MDSDLVVYQWYSGRGEIITVGNNGGGGKGGQLKS